VVDQSQVGVGVVGWFLVYKVAAWSLEWVDVWWWYEFGDAVGHHDFPVRMVDQGMVCSGSSLNRVGLVRRVGLIGRLVTS
jgi:hypothetical protein